MTTKFDKCVGYVRRLAKTWPNMANLVGHFDTCLQNETRNLLNVTA